MAQAQPAPGAADVNELSTDYRVLRSRAIQPREAKVASVLANRHDQLADLFLAVRDKDHPVEFEAGLRGRKRRKLADAGVDGQVQLEGLDEFRKRFSDPQRFALSLSFVAPSYSLSFIVDSLQQLDLSLPPLSPSPPPPPPQASTSAPAPAAPKPLPLSAVANDSEEDAEGEEEDEEIAVAEALAPPGVSVTTTMGTPASSSSAPRTVDPSAAGPSAIASTSRPQIALTAPSATPSETPISPTPVPASGPAPPTTVAPSLLTAAPTPPTSASPQPPTPSVPYEPVPPYHSLFGIHEVSSDYPSALPPVPHDILRNRLNTSLLLRSNTKKTAKSLAPASSSALVQPDLYKLHVRAQHMGAKTFLGPGKRVHNALQTREWDVGIDEMRAIRAFERIEQLKNERAWSFRQPKKQRTGVVPKAHWDHVLDEMRWMQIDFRQESRWKVVSAYKLARACRAYHRAAPDDRASLRVRTRPPRELSKEELDARREGRELPEADERMDVEVADDAAPAKADKGKGKERADSEEADADGEADADADGEVDDSTPALSTAPPTAAASTSTTPAPGVVPVANAPPGAGKAGGSMGNEATPVPPAGSLSRVQAAQLEAQRQHAQAQHIQKLITFRNPIFDAELDDTVIDPLVLAALRDACAPPPAAATSSSDASSSSTDAKTPEDDPFLSYTFATLFPDLPLYSDFIVANDPALDRRVEDSSAWAGRLAHVTRLLERKPLLVSTLEPGRTRTTRGWNASTAAVVEDVKDPLEGREAVPTSASALFASRKPKDATLGEVLTRPAEVVPQPDIRATSILWLPEEDAKLLALQKQYGFNWTLVAQVFNQTTHRPKSDHRLAWDMYDRWDKLVGPGSKKTLPDGTEIVKPPPEWIPPLDKLTGRPAPIVGDGSKKKARHVAILDAMKKVQKKRETWAQKQPPPGFPRRINMSMHDSHNLPPRPSWDPMQWSMYKAEQEQQKARLRQQQAAQQAQQAQQQAAQQAAQQQALAQQHPPRPPSALPPQMAAAAHASPNGTLAQLPGSPAGATPPLANGTPAAPQQLTPEQLHMLQQRQNALLQAQAQAVAAQRAAHAQAQAAAQQAQLNGAGGQE
ncbi:RNA polymerase II transcription elongation factor SpEAF [Rhodotorula kratochvilovae]